MQKLLPSLLIFFIISCSKKLPEEIQKAIFNILNENQSIQENLLKNQIPSFNKLQESIDKAIQLTSKEELQNLNSKLKDLKSTLKESKNETSEESFESISNFSIKLSEILVENKINSEYNKFYCPMVSKFWIAKGTEIQNPYAPEMRDCGEVVK